jgi:hypothetical protein
MLEDAFLSRAQHVNDGLIPDLDDDLRKLDFVSSSHLESRQMPLHCLDRDLRSLPALAPEILREHRHRFALLGLTDDLVIPDEANFNKVVPCLERP